LGSEVDTLNEPTHSFSPRLRAPPSFELTNSRLKEPPVQRGRTFRAESSFCIEPLESIWAPGRIFPINLLHWHKALLHFCSAYFSFYASCAIHPFSSPEDFHGRVVTAGTTVYTLHRTAHLHTNTTPPLYILTHLIQTQLDLPRQGSTPPSAH
jgi:hypothetical protein